MGFHKRWIKKENLVGRYKDGGIESIRKYFNADALMLSDEFSSTIFDLISDKKDDEAIKLLDNEKL
jgi:hypothetical protein